MREDTERRWAGLMRDGLAGDGAAYGRLLTELTPLIRAEVARAGARWPRSGLDAEDVVQETLIALHTKRHTWDASRPIVPWVRAITRYKSVDALRRRGRRQHVPIDDVAETLPSPEPEADLVIGMERYLKILPPRQREVVDALAVNGSSVREAASRLDMTENAVRVTFHRGLKALLKTFGSDPR